MHKPKIKQIGSQVCRVDYARAVIAGDMNLRDVPANFKSVTKTFIDQARLAKDRLALMHGVKIARMRSKDARRAALEALPIDIRAASEKYARYYFEKMKGRHV
jgi:hypothetical protein